MTDGEFMLAAAREAAKGLGHTRPNPAVGALIVRDGRIVAKGYHRRCGLDHAEVAAIKNARRRHEPTAGTTLYVTLEPCSRPGRVGACTEAIAEAGFARVVYAVSDPNPVNRGRARRVLSAHGIACERLRGEKAVVDECNRLIAPFRKHVVTAMPYVTVKLAMSLDGKICDDWGKANWISSAESRRRTNLMRSSYDAIMVGAETIRKDNPSLLARVRRNDDLVRVVVSRSGKIDGSAQVFADGRNQTLVFDDAKKALVELGRRGITSVLCEGGMELARSLAEAGLVDEWLGVIAPLVIGSSRIGQARRGKMGECGRPQKGEDCFCRAGFSRFAQL